MTKTNVMRLLEAAGISYRTAEYEYDESNLPGLHAVPKDLTHHIHIPPYDKRSLPPLADASHWFLS